MESVCCPSSEGGGATPEPLDVDTCKGNLVADSGPQSHCSTSIELRAFS